jgi:hypothetical protein
MTDLHRSDELELACDAVIAAIRRLREVGAFLLTTSEEERLFAAQSIAETLPFVDR